MCWLPVPLGRTITQLCDQVVACPECGKVMGCVGGYVRARRRLEGAEARPGIAARVPPVDVYIYTCYTYPMKRIQLHLTDRQARQLAALAKRHSVSRAELIRRGVDLLVREEASGEEPLLGLVGAAGPIGRSDVAEHHDDVLYVRDSAPARASRKRRPARRK